MTPVEGSKSGVDNTVACGPWEMRWLGPANEAGRRPSHPVERDPKVAEILSRCGDGSVETPWKPDALIELAEHMRGVPAVVNDEIQA